MTETMTVQQIAELMNVSKKTVTRINSEIMPGKMQPRIKTELNEIEALSVIKKIKIEVGQNVSVLRQNGSEPLQNAELVASNQVDKSVVDAIIYAYEKGKSKSINKPALPEPDGYMTALAYCIKNGMTTDADFVARLGKSASRICRNQGIPIKQVEHEKYGRVNSYPEEMISVAVRQL